MKKFDRDKIFAAVDESNKRISAMTPEERKQLQKDTQQILKDIKSMGPSFNGRTYRWQ